MNSLPQWHLKCMLMKAGKIASGGLAALVLSSASVAASAAAVEHGKGIASKIIGGYDVPDGRFPFMASIQVKLDDGDFHGCGGSLISPRLVLTASHCIRGYADAVDKLAVVVGRTSLSDGSQGYRRNVRQMHLLDDWSYDMGVLELEQPVTEVAPISLAVSGNDEFEKPGHWVRNIGWGRTAQEPVPISPDRMQQVELPVISAERCAQSHPDVQPENEVCAGQAGIGSCNGDSGGPLFVQEPATQRFIQIGIVSRGGKICAADKPGIYTRLSNPVVADFINNIPR